MIIHIVEGDSRSYDDGLQWLVKGFEDPAKAEALRDELNEAVTKIKLEIGRTNEVYKKLREDENSDWQALTEARKQRDAARELTIEKDPDADITEATNYYTIKLEVELE